MTNIEYLVIAGAGPNGLGQLGVLDVLLDNKYFKMKNIKKNFCYISWFSYCMYFSTWYRCQRDDRVYH